ncbi:MAG: ATP-binding protein [Candidatus Kariarchaeaceae archaeon]|jgi:hypothetical protein
MDSIVEELTGPTNPNDFVGRSTIVDAYHELLREFVRSNNTVKWVHISGVSGTGKSSLLRKLRMMTEMERIATGSVEVPISSINANQLLNDIKRVLDEMAPEWRSFVQRKRNVSLYNVPAPPESTKDVVTDSALKKIVDAFFEDLDRVDIAMKREKQKHGIFLDDLDRLLAYNYTSLLTVWQEIAKRLLEEDFNLLFVTTGHYSANRYLGLTGNNDSVLHLKLNQFDFTEAELMVRRRGKLVKSERESVVQASTRFPFDLALRQLILSKGFDPTTLNAKIITDTFGFAKDEVKLLRDLSKYEVNFFNLEDFTRVHSTETIEGLKNALLFNITPDGYFAFDSNAVWELISHVFKPIDPRTEVILILDRLRDQAERSQLPTRRDLKIVQEHFQSIEDNALIFELSGQLADTTKAALEGSLFHTAWELLELATIGLHRTGDFEKIADLQETIAKGFAKVNHDYFAAKSFQKAGMYFREAGVEWRSVTNFREAGQKFRREAERTDPKIYHYALRSMLRQSILAFLKANERSQAKRVMKQAKDLLGEYENHISYFDKIEEISE